MLPVGAMSSWSDVKLHSGHKRSFCCAPCSAVLHFKMARFTNLTNKWKCYCMLLWHAHTAHLLDPQIIALITNSNPLISASRKTTLYLRNGKLLMSSTLVNWLPSWKWAHEIIQLRHIQCGIRLSIIWTSFYYSHIFNAVITGSASQFPHF